MNVAEYIHSLGVGARAAAAELAKRSTAEKNAALLKIADALEVDEAAVAAANARDVENARAAGISPAMIDRLTLTPTRFKAMVDGVRYVASLPDPVGETIWTRERPSGISIRKVRVPFGVVAVVFESRPNVFVDTAALCLKTGNAIILRGGKEAIESNKALAASVAVALAGAGMGAAVQFVDIPDHSAVAEMVRAVGLVDIAIPRGGERLIRAMCEAALIPVLKHYKGVCHVYVDEKADLAMALSILDNAKVQRPSACNAAETLLVHEKIAPAFLPKVRAWAAEKGVALHEEPAVESVESGARGEAGVDWDREFLALELNVGVVKDCRAAIAHVNAHGSHHSDCIVTSDAACAAEFLRDVDSATVYHNASTRFTDGGEFGMGAEIGISTDKLHARGPMGLEELTTYKYQITGDGAVRK
ncbi:MAG: glutamate-5-semialdehyde dehydrogenase [Kiritimatiellae bacterium]|nr:glutamate-5-semialdehyde dehydrogenase [Kiritimatiellia bacterium]